MENKALSCPECGPLFGVLILLSAFWDLVAAGLLFLGVVGWGLLGLLCMPLPMLVLLGLWLKFWVAARLLKPLRERYPKAFPPMSRAFFYGILGYTGFSTLWGNLFGLLAVVLFFASNLYRDPEVMALISTEAEATTAPEEG